eukprot:scaffold185730_cov26-Attheya_sp.AAC.1
MAPLWFPILRASARSLFRVVSSTGSRGKMAPFVKICFIFGHRQWEWNMGSRRQHLPVGFGGVSIHGKLELGGFKFGNWSR